jgi:hypothetical protein
MARRVEAARRAAVRDGHADLNRNSGWGRRDDGDVRGAVLLRLPDDRETGRYAAESAAKDAESDGDKAEDDESNDEENEEKAAACTSSGRAANNVRVARKGDCMPVNVHGD